MGFKIVRNDIIKMNTDAIVNTANQYVQVGPGCDTAIYNAAGYETLLSYRKEKIGEVAEGEVFITPGFELQNKYIIHAVSPAYMDGGQKEEEKLRSCYKKSLQLAKEYGIKSIAFPLISTGSFGYPKEEGIRIAVDEIYDFLFENEMDIYLVVFDSRAVELGEKIDPNLEEYIDHNYVREKSEEEFLTRSFAPYPASAMNDAIDCDSDFDTDRAPAMRFNNVNAKIAKSPQKRIRNEQISLECIESAPCVDLADVDNVEILEERLNERVKHMSDTFSEYLLYLIERKGLSNVEVYKKSIVDKKTFSKIKNDKNYHPQKLTALCLCIGARLNMDEAQDLLARAGYALSPCDMTDIIFSFFIENEIYEMTELDIQLEEHGQPCIIQ